MKTKIFNLVILDESGSMECIRKQTISGCNETINTIRLAQEKHSESQQHYVSIYTFQSEGSLPSRYIIKDEPALMVNNMTEDDYSPNGLTPLYDAVGTTLNELRDTVKKYDIAIGSVTIISDGLENASKIFTGKTVSSLISELKTAGWNFNFIGANIDVKTVARDLNIDNTLEFEQSNEGTRRMFLHERRSRMNYYCRIQGIMESKEDINPSDLSEANENYFEK